MPSVRRRRWDGCGGFRSRLYFWVLEKAGGDGDGGDGCGFGAEDAGAEGDVLPVVLGEEGHFFGGPAAFGADGQGVGQWVLYV